jgi:hypothetical protein
VRFVFHLLLMTVVALGIGFGLSAYALSEGAFAGVVHIGPWIAWPDSGKPDPNPYSRAYIARAGAFQLGRSEGLQFTAGTDSAGRPLDRSCRYRITGDTPVATFWTLVAVDPDWVNIASPEGRPALRSSMLARARDGSIIAYVSRRLSPWNWLEITGNGRFQLVLTLYDTSLLQGFDDESADLLPAITREGCA